jgi:medium-chain acyl-[acyl-carrier-protein] hydrolase
MSTMSSERSSWFPFRRPRPAARLRLFCFPYAGGGATLYHPWREALGDEIEVCAVQLPGRENRYQEKPYRRMEPLVDDLLGRIDPLLDRPFAFFGYSMGAAIAHETALRLAESHGRVPEHLFACAQRAPHLEVQGRLTADQMSDAELRDRLARLDGTPSQVLDSPELMELFGPRIRADLELNDSYLTSADRVHDCPLTVFGGRHDRDVSERGLEAWSCLTRGPFRMRVLDGGHFFIRERLDDVIAEVRNDLALPLSS